MQKASVAEPIRKSDLKDIDAEIIEDCVDVSIGFDDEKDSLSLDEHLKHLSDTFSEYLLYLIQSRGMKNADVSEIFTGIWIPTSARRKHFL